MTDSYTTETIAKFENFKKSDDLLSFIVPREVDQNTPLEGHRCYATHRLPPACFVLCEPEDRATKRTEQMAKALVEQMRFAVLKELEHTACRVMSINYHLPQAIADAISSLGIDHNSDNTLVMLNLGKLSDELPRLGLDDLAEGDGETCWDVFDGKVMFSRTLPFVGCVIDKGAVKVCYRQPVVAELVDHVNRKFEHEVTCEFFVEIDPEHCVVLAASSSLDHTLTPTEQKVAPKTLITFERLAAGHTLTEPTEGFDPERDAATVVKPSRSNLAGGHLPHPTRYYN